MINDPLVSICIPAFNVEMTIRDTLDSLVSQTYKNIKIFVGDNNSSDKTSDIIQSFVDRDPRIHLIRHPENIGYVNNINSLVDLTSTDFVAIYHADDIYNKDIISKQTNILLSNPGAGVAFPKMHLFYNNNIEKISSWDYQQYFQALQYDTKCYWGHLKEYIPVIASVGNLFSCPGLMVKRKVYDEAGRYTDTYKTNEDLDLWLRILEKGYSIGIIDEYLMKYRISIASSSFRNDQIPVLNAFFKVVDDFLIRRNEFATPELVKAYSINKSIKLLETAFKAFKQNNKELLLRNTTASIEQNKFPMFSKWGLIQRAPRLFFLIAKYFRKL